MNFFVGNIDTKNIALLEKAGAASSVQFRQGHYMTSSINNNKLHDFHPIFCASKDDAAKLLKGYFELAKNNTDSNNFENDSYMLSGEDVKNS